jgi:hypothetical protein
LFKFEITAPNRPQPNGKIERKFATMWGKVRAMLSAAKLPWKIRNTLWAQCAKHCTDLENSLVKKGKRSSYERIFKKIPEWVKYLHTSGEIVVVHNNKDIQSKSCLRGISISLFKHKSMIVKMKTIIQIYHYF